MGANHLVCEYYASDMGRQLMECCLLAGDKSHAVAELLMMDLVRG